MFKIFNRLSWKQTISLNLSILVLTGGLVALSSVQQPTRTVTKASLPLPTPTPIPVYPANPPTITALEPFFAKPGDAMRLKGEHFGQAQWQSTLKYGSIPLMPEHILSWTDAHIDFILPAKAITASPLFLTVNGRSTKSDLVSLYRSSQDPALSVHTQDLTAQLDISNLNTPATLVITLKNSAPSTPLTPPQKTIPSANSITHFFQLEPGTTNLLQAQSIDITHALLLDPTNQPLPLYLKP